MSLLSQPVWRMIDQSALGSSFDGRQSFALDDALCESVGSGQSPAAARLWVHDRTIMLGTQDTRLPFFHDALGVLKQAGFRYLVRNSGGLAVVLDSGVLNLSLIFSERDGLLSIDEPFQAMAEFISHVLTVYGVSCVPGEVSGSYCPGRYDLSIGGRKFAGISQRRVRKGVAVQIYLCVDGSGPKRAELIRAFYKKGLRGQPTRFHYPHIEPEVMGSLEELCHRKISVSGLTETIIRSLSTFGQLASTPLSEQETRLFGSYYERMIRRNEKVFEHEQM
ncbi:lipoate--protein ligase family protein [Sporolactobacillus vineae]|uniref:lipoate--protein ligase family protein n=1 Tax=Sporolactobacillus vineae TaxID=444463 RepID=UPI000289C54E|nr:lipoate--protein ligase family protein [Sporolactobacillus vineae]